MNKKILLLVSLVFSLSLLFAESLEPPKPIAPPPPKESFRQHRNFRGKRMIDEEIDFRLMYVKSTKIPNAVLFELVFSQPINPETVNDNNFLFNGEMIPAKMIQFSKNYRTISYLLDHEDFLQQNQSYTFEIKNIESIRGEIAESVEFKDFQTNEEYRYSMREEKWKKF